MYRQTNSPKTMCTGTLPSDLLGQMRELAQKLGFADIGVSGINLANAELKFLEWLERGFHGEMDYMQRHGTKRSRPTELVTGTASVISVRMNYLPQTSAEAITCLNQPDQAYISRYALGRDYHKLIRKRLKQLAEQINTLLGPFGYRVFTDSAPILEKPISAHAGLGWVGKHSNLLCREQGSWFFLGEIFIDVALSPSQPVMNHCGDCTACIDVCPTDAIVVPYVVDARKCISYLTIEYQGVIPEIYRKAIGNRIYGCDDCQLFCPWNRFAPQTEETDFLPRQSLDEISLLALFSWTEQQFLDRFQGSPIRRIGYESWMRNIIIALGNATDSKRIVPQLTGRRDSASELLQTHIDWAVEQHNTGQNRA